MESWASLKEGRLRQKRYLIRRGGILREKQLNEGDATEGNDAQEHGNLLSVSGTT